MCRKRTITTKSDGCQELFIKNREILLTVKRVLCYSKKCAIMERYTMYNVFFCYGIELFSLYIEDLRNRDKREVWITDRKFAGGS